MRADGVPWLLALAAVCTGAGASEVDVLLGGGGVGTSASGNELLHSVQLSPEPLEEMPGVGGGNTNIAPHQRWPAHRVVLAFDLLGLRATPFEFESAEARGGLLAPFTSALDGVLRGLLSRGAKLRDDAGKAGGAADDAALRLLPPLPAVQGGLELLSCTARVDEGGRPILRLRLSIPRVTASPQSRHALQAAAAAPSALAALQDAFAAAAPAATLDMQVLHVPTRRKQRKHVAVTTAMATADDDDDDIADRKVVVTSLGSLVSSVLVPMVAEAKRVVAAHQALCTLLLLLLLLVIKKVSNNAALSRLNHRRQRRASAASGLGWGLRRAGGSQGERGKRRKQRDKRSQSPPPPAEGESLLKKGDGVAVELPSTAVTDGGDSVSDGGDLESGSVRRASGVGVGDSPGGTTRTMRRRSSAR